MKSLSIGRSALSIALLLAAASLGCANYGPGLRGTPCPVAWVPSESIHPAAAQLRAGMVLRVGDEEIHLEVIAENRPKELVVVALARFGVRLFAIRQRGVEVLVEGASTDDLDRIAIWTLDALHRVYWIEAPRDSSDIQWSRAGEEIRETSADGRRRREFSLSRIDDPTRRVAIDYARSAAASDARYGDVSIRNPWCGYEADIVPIGSTKSLRRRPLSKQRNEAATGGEKSWEEKPGRAIPSRAGQRSTLWDRRPTLFATD